MIHGRERRADSFTPHPVFKGDVLRLHSFKPVSLLSFQRKNQGGPRLCLRLSQGARLSASSPRPASENAKAGKYALMSFHFRDISPFVSALTSEQLILCNETSRKMG